MSAEQCELCIVGAGMAGLNALVVASQYLKKSDKVILVDRRPMCGGMWTDTYDYVRLHQPYFLFTAGDIPWKVDRKRSHLATKPEVLAHFRRCMEILHQKITLVECFGYEYESCLEVPKGGGYGVEIDLKSISDGSPMKIHARRCIKALGFQIPVNHPIKFNSSQVRSISPHDDILLGEEMRASDKPVYIVGGGKTAMDTAHALLSQFPGKRINLLVGEGTMFFNRDQFFQPGLKRWWGGQGFTDALLDVTLRFDGDNLSEVVEYFRAKYSISLDKNFKQFLTGILSEEENRFIANGIGEIIVEYVRDVVDIDGKPAIVFRNGGCRAIEPGGWMVNCTGYVLRQQHPYEPYISPHGAVASIQATSMVLYLSTHSAYFLTHLFYLGKLGTLPLYEFDQETLAQKDKTTNTFVGLTHMMHNLLLIFDQVPMRVMSGCGTDFERWYPLHRRLFIAWKLKRNTKKYLEHYRKVLDRIHEKYQIRCGVLETIRPA